MGIQYKSSDNTWTELVLPSSMIDPDVNYQLEVLAIRVEEVEKLIQGLATFAGVSL